MGGNKNYSILLSAFIDVEEIASRLENNIKLLVLVEKDYQSKPFFRNKEPVIPREGQLLLRRSDKLTRSIKTDFKALYIFTKIFIDKYVQYLCFLSPVNEIKCGSIRVHMNLLQSYLGKNSFIVGYKDKIMDELNQLNETLTFYRDDYVVHSDLQQNFDVWFVCDMQEGVKFAHVNRDKKEEILSLNPKDLLQICLDFIFKSQGYFLENWCCDNNVLK